jgi:predicted PurR-regulated permease PerM
VTESAAWRVVARGIFLVVVLLLLLALIRELKGVLIQLLLAVLIAAALTPIVDSVSKIGESRRWRWRPSRGITAVAIFIVILLGLLGGVVALVSAVIPDLRQLAVNLPGYVQRAQSSINAFMAERPELFGPLGGTGSQLQVQDVLAGAAGVATQAPRLVSVATGAVAEVLYMVFALILALYLTIDGHNIRHYLVQFFPFDRQDQAMEVADRIGRRLGAWARGQALLGAIVGTMTWIAALVIGLPYLAALALIAAVGELIPGIGPIIAAIPFVVIGFLSSPTQGLSALVAAIVIQQLENHLIVPRVMGHAVDLHPVVVMVAILAGGELLGVMGALLAVPVAASLAVVVDEIQRERVARRQGAPEAETPLA